MSRLGGGIVLVGALLLCIGPSGRGDAPQGEVKPPPSARPVDSLGDPLPRGARARIGTVRFRHGGQIQSLRCLPDGKTLLAYGGDQFLRFWDAENGKELRHFKAAFDANNIRYLQMLGRGNFAGLNGLSEGGGSQCLTSDGRIMIVPEGTNVLKVRELDSGKVLRELKFETGNLRCVALSPDDKVIGAAVFEQDPNTGAQSGRIRLWELATGKELPELVGPKPKQEGQMSFVPNYFVFSPNSKSVAAVGMEFQGRNGVVRVWQMGKEKEPIRLIEHGGSIGPIVFSPDGRLLAEISANPITGGNAHLRLWDTFTGKEIQELGEDPNGSTLLTFSPDGKYLVDIDANTQSVHIWDAANGKEVTTLNNLLNISALVVAPDSKTFAAGIGDGTIRLHETSTGKELHQMKGYQPNPGMQVPMGSIQNLGTPLAFSLDGKVLYSTGGNMIRRYETATGKEISLSKDGPETPLSDLLFTADGKELQTVGSEGLRVWDLATLRRLRAVEGPMTDEGEPVAASCLTLSPDGKTLAIGWNFGQITLNDTATGKELRRLEGGHEMSIVSLVFSGTGKALVSSCMGGQVLWWDATTGKQVRYLVGKAPAAEEVPPPVPFAPPPPGNTSGPVRLVMMPDGGTVAGAGADEGLFKVRFWELATGKLRRTLLVDSLAGDLKDRAKLELDDVPVNENMGGVLTQLAIAPDGKHMVLGFGPNIELRELRRGREVRQFSLNGQMTCLKFSPSGKHLAAGSDDGSIRLWDMANGTVLTEMRGHRGGVTAIAFAPDGKTIASIGSDSNLLFWDVKECLDTDFPTPRLTDKELDGLWRDLADADAEKGYLAVQRLAEAPEQALPLLRERLKPVPVVEKQQMTKLIDDLEHTRFEQRKRAAAELEKLAEQAEPALAARLKDNPSVDLKQVLEKLLDLQAGPAVVPEQVRALRGVEVLRDIDTPEARQLLEKMAKGAPDSRVTQAARSLLDRLTRRE